MKKGFYPMENDGKIEDLKKLCITFYVDGKKTPRNMLRSFLADSVRHYDEVEQELEMKGNFKFCHKHPRLMTRELLFHLFRNLHNTSSVQFGEEFEIYQKKSEGALIWSAEPGVFTNCNSFDYNSHYPSIYLKPDFRFPVRQGKYEEFTDEKNLSLDELAFYNIHVETEKVGHVFKKNSSNVYTNYDLQALKHHNIAYKFTEKRRYVYEASSCISTRFFLKKTIDKLFEMKKKGNVYAKEIMNSIWGTMSQLYLIKCNMNSPTYSDLRNTNEVYEFHPIAKYVEFYSVKRPFKFSLSRIKPFILSRARLDISKAVKKVKDEGYEIIRIHTDCVVCNMSSSAFDKKVAPISDNMGDFKVELKKIDPKKTYAMENVNCIYEVDE